MIAVLILSIAISCLAIVISLAVLIDQSRQARRHKEFRRRLDDLERDDTGVT